MLREHRLPIYGNPQSGHRGAPGVDPKRVQKNKTINQYYKSNKDLCKEVDVWQLRTSDPYIQGFRRIVSKRFALQAKAWQIAVMKDILYDQNNVVISAGTSQGKSLTFQALLTLSKTGIVLVTCPTLSLIDDQVCISASAQ